MSVFFFPHSPSETAAQKLLFATIGETWPLSSMREKSSENKRPAAVTEPNAMELSFVEIAEALDTCLDRARLSRPLSQCVVRPPGMGSADPTGLSASDASAR